MPIATGLEREELEAELQVRWPGPLSGLCWGAAGAECTSDSGRMGADSSIWSGFCRERSGLTWIPLSAPSVPR